MTAKTNFISREDLAQRFAGKSVAIVGSGPGCLRNEGEFIDSHDLVVRINNYKIKNFESKVGRRTDVFYSFFGNSIHKTAQELQADGVTLCMCKCPDGKVIESEWHRKNNKEIGVDFRWIWSQRASWWFCDVHGPSVAEFQETMAILQGHIPTTGFAAIMEIIRLPIRSLYVTGFDFFESGIHNVNEPWREKNTDDPICHRPDLEKALMRKYLMEGRIEMNVDDKLSGILAGLL